MRKLHILLIEKKKERRNKWFIYFHSDTHSHTHIYLYIYIIFCAIWCDFFRVTKKLKKEEEKKQHFLLHLHYYTAPDTIIYPLDVSQDDIQLQSSVR